MDHFCEIQFSILFDYAYFFSSSYEIFFPIVRSVSEALACRFTHWEPFFSLLRSSLVALVELSLRFFPSSALSFLFFFQLIMMSASRVFCSTLSICKYLFHFYISIFVNVHVFLATMKTLALFVLMDTC